jgi:hypothetical protein
MLDFLSSFDTNIAIIWEISKQAKAIQKIYFEQPFPTVYRVPFTVSRLWGGCGTKRK